MHNPFLGRPELARQLLRHIHGVPAVPLGNISGLAKKLEDRLAGFIEFIVIALRALSGSRKWNDIGTRSRVVSLTGAEPWLPCRTERYYSGSSSPDDRLRALSVGFSSLVATKPRRQSSIGIGV